jgi:tRNA pseudouridine55 synthase
VALIRRLTGEKRVGHAGTLDPAATGVLPVCIGQATRIVEYFLDAAKSYLALIELGITTDTYDAAGRIITKQDASEISRERFEAALDSFRGRIYQTPPMYSAVKYQGRPLYKLARAGVVVERKERVAEVYKLELSDWKPPVATLEVVCGKGTYIRSLAHDLGKLLGCGASLRDLARTGYGPFEIREALSLPQVKEAFHNGYLHLLTHPMDSVLRHLPSAVVSEDEEASIRNGRALVLADSDHLSEQTPNRCRAYSLDGRFLGVLRFKPDDGHWRPEKVFT